MSGKRVAIVQSNYIPWKGYFDLIGLVDEFILLDDAQFTKRDWRNRNKIKTADGLKWLTIPVITKGRYEQPIDEVEISETWAEQHWRSISHAYAKAPYFQDYKARIEALYEAAEQLDRLSLVNHLFLEGLCKELNLSTKLTWSRSYPIEGGKTERLLSLCKGAGAKDYLSGPAAQSYLDEALFTHQGISVSWMDYSGYPEYPQLHGAFEQGVSLLDLLFMTGPQARDFMKSP